MNPSWSVRVRTESKGTAVAYARNHSIRVGPPLSFEPKDALPCGLELMLAALGADILYNLSAHLSRKRIEIDDAELTLTCKLENALAHLGVIGEEGTPRAESIEGVLYLAASPSASELETLLAESLTRAPTYLTLARATTITLRLAKTG